MNKTGFVVVVSVLAMGSASLRAEETEVAYSLHDSFEKFSGASGEKINGLASDSGRFTWRAPNSFTVVKNDGTAYHKNNYLRITDNTSGQHASTILLEAENRAPAPTAPDNKPTTGTPVSFALRRAVIPGQEDNVAGISILFYFSNEDESVKGDSGDYNFFKGWTVSADKWYRFEGLLLTYHWNATQTQVAIANGVIKDAATGDVVYTFASAPRANLSGNLDKTYLRGIRFQTGGVSQAIIDIDDIRIGDVKEPQSMVITVF